DVPRCRGGGPRPRTSRGGFEEVRRPGAADGASRRLPRRHGNRGSGGLRAPGGGNRTRLRPAHLLRGKAHLRTRALVRPLPAQRDRIRYPAPAPVRGTADGGPPGPRAGVIAQNSATALAMASVCVLEKIG